LAWLCRQEEQTVGGQIFKRVGWRQKEPSIRLLASYEAVSTIIKVQDSGISLIKVTNRKLIRISNYYDEIIQVGIV